MGWVNRARSRARGWFNDGPALQQGNGLDTAYTPLPRLDEYGDTSPQPQGVLPLLQPSPDHINYASLHCAPLARTQVRLRNEVWRRGLEVRSTHDYFCTKCGAGSDKAADGCPKCHAEPGYLAEPNDDERQRLEEFAERANDDGDTLEDVGQRKTEEMLKHGRGFLIKKYAYEVEGVTLPGGARNPTSGRIDKATLRAVNPGDPGRIYKVRDHLGRTGRRFICLPCRTNAAQGTYEPEKKNQGCPACGTRILHEARYLEYQTVLSSEAKTWYTAQEVSETRWPYKDGSSPVTRLWLYVVTWIWMARYAAWALDPRRDKRPDTILVTVGGDEQSVRAWAKRDAEERKKNPYKISHLHIPGAPGGMEDLKPTAMVLNLGDKEFRGQMPELREEIKNEVHAQYHVSPMQSGDVQTSGGLNSEGEQLRSTGQVAEDIQGLEEQCLRDVARALGCVQFTYGFKPSLEEDDAKRTAVEKAELEKGKLAVDVGLSVKWEDGRAIISDGILEEPKQPPLGGFGAPGGGVPPGSPPGPAGGDGPSFPAEPPKGIRPHGLP